MRSLKNIPMKKFLKTPFKDQAGFTILEILISVTIMSVGILGLLSSANSVKHYQQNSKDTTLATMHAASKLEEIKRAGTNEPTGGAFGFDYLIDDTAGGYLNGYTATDDWTRSSSDTVEGITRNWTLSVYPPAAQTGTQSFLAPGGIRMVEAVVTSSWTDEKNQPQSVQMAVVLHRRQFVGAN